MPISEQSAQFNNHVGSDEIFDTWTSLIAEVEKTSPGDVEKISSVYDSFLSEFPLCYGYWRKYAGHKARLCIVDKVVEVYERAVQSATYCVELWVDYCSFSMLLFEDPENVRSFKKLAAIWEEELNLQSNDAAEVQSDPIPNGEITHVKTYDDEDISFVIKDLLDPTIGLRRLSALQKYLFTGELFFQNASDLDAKICFFETRIGRPYFHVKPLDVSQIENWHQYLDFVEMQGDFDWTVKLHERCLIPCANYPEFWMRYVEFMETKGGREIANFALVRATQVFMKRVPAIHLLCARFKEKIGDALGTRAVFRQCDSELSSDLVENVTREANMEKRLGNPAAAFKVYEEALEMAIEKQKSHIFSVLSVNFSRFKYMVTGSVDAARDVLIKGIQHLPHCKVLIEGLLNFETMHNGRKQVDVVDSIVSKAISPGPDASHGLSNEDSRRYIKTLYREGRHDVVISLPHTVSGDETPHISVLALQPDQKSSVPENTDIQPDIAPVFESQLVCIDSTMEKLQPLASPKIVEQSGEDVSKQNEETSNLLNEVAVDRQVLVTAQEFPEGANEVQKKADCEPNDDLRPPSLDTLSINSQNDETQDYNPTTSHNCGTLRSNGRTERDGDYPDGVSLSNLACTQSSGQAHAQSDCSPQKIPSDLSSQKRHRRSQRAIPTSHTSNRSVGNEENRYRKNYGEALVDARSGILVSPKTQQPQQLQAYPQPQSVVLSRAPTPCKEPCQVQGTTELNIEAAGPSMSPPQPQQNPPSNE
ncbi:hypothetical protein IFM89_006132 [Coptis chinensis]|uniref:Pre-mRNA-processing factor 39 n=1 Tax=Coptis chinensis TaxID=261450 RepID=A0A835GZ89_9MAGN|nr:hypothetical protein IFM89_006132 [Coptis chinensis]